MPSLLQWVKLKAIGRFSSAINIKTENKTKIKLQQFLRNILCSFDNLVEYCMYYQTKTIQASFKVLSSKLKAALTALNPLDSGLPLCLVAVVLRQQVLESLQHPSEHPPALPSLPLLSSLVLQW